MQRIYGREVTRQMIQASSKSMAQTNPRLPYSPSRNLTNQKHCYMSKYYPYSILHTNLTPTLSLPYLRLACAVLSLGPIDKRVKQKIAKETSNHTLILDAQH